MADAKLSTEDFPVAGTNRFWNVTRSTNQKNPVKVELREQTIDRKTDRTGEARLSWSQVVGFENTIADPDEITKTAALILYRVGRIDEVVGVFG